MFADFLGAIDRPDMGRMSLARARRDLELLEAALLGSTSSAPLDPEVTA